MPGAFETPYQSAPLDMAEDAFYYMRKDLIEARLTEIKDGQAREILERHDSKYREKETWCVGVRWDICERTDLVEILEVGVGTEYEPRVNYLSMIGLLSSVWAASRYRSFVVCSARIMQGEAAGYQTSLSGTPKKVYANLLKSKGQVIQRKRTKRCLFDFALSSISY